jgi:hypothetical protein
LPKGANPCRKPGKSRGPEVAAPSLDYSATDRYSAEELLILLINFMKKMKSEQAVLPNPCLEEED